jgi:hypothetical protein
MEYWPVHRIHQERERVPGDDPVPKKRRRRPYGGWRYDNKRVSKKRRLQTERMRIRRAARRAALDGQPPLPLQLQMEQKVRAPMMYLVQFGSSHLSDDDFKVWDIPTLVKASTRDATGISLVQWKPVWVSEGDITPSALDYWRINKARPISAEYR